MYRLVGVTISAGEFRKETTVRGYTVYLLHLAKSTIGAEMRSSDVMNTCVACRFFAFTCIKIHNYIYIYISVSYTCKTMCITCIYLNNIQYILYWHVSIHACPLQHGIDQAISPGAASSGHKSMHFRWSCTRRENLSNTRLTRH